MERDFLHNKVPNLCRNLNIVCGHELPQPVEQKNNTHSVFALTFPPSSCLTNAAIRIISCLSRRPFQLS